MRRALANILILLAIVVLQGCEREGHAKLILVNDSNLVITELNVEVAGSAYTKRMIKPHGEVTFEFRVPYDSDYKVDVLFSNGNRKVRRVGYLTRGFSIESKIIIYEERIEIIDIQSKMTGVWPFIDDETSPK